MVFGAKVQFVEFILLIFNLKEMIIECSIFKLIVGLEPKCIELIGESEREKICQSRKRKRNEGEN